MALNDTHYSASFRCRHLDYGGISKVRQPHQAHQLAQPLLRPPNRFSTSVRQRSKRPTPIMSAPELNNAGSNKWLACHIRLSGAELASLKRKLRSVPSSMAVSPTPSLIVSTAETSSSLVHAFDNSEDAFGAVHAP